MPSQPHRALAAAALLGLLASASCDSASRIDNFDVRVTGVAQIPGATTLGGLLSAFPQLAETTRFDLTQSTTFQNKNYDPSDVDSVVLERLTFRVLSPEGQDLAFLGEVVFYLETDGLPRIEIARQDTFPAGATTVELDTVGTNLKDYVLAREATVTTEVTDSQAPPEETDIEVELVFDVDVDVI